MIRLSLQTVAKIREREEERNYITLSSGFGGTKDLMYSYDMSDLFLSVCFTGLTARLFYSLPTVLKKL